MSFGDLPFVEDHIDPLSAEFDLFEAAVLAHVIGRGGLTNHDVITRLLDVHGPQRLLMCSLPRFPDIGLFPLDTISAGRNVRIDADRFVGGDADAGSAFWTRLYWLCVSL